MNAPDDDYDDDGLNGYDHDLDDEAAPEALVWQLLLMINPGDEESALQQFADYREALAEAGGETDEPVWLLRDAIDWKAGFYVDAEDTASFIDSLNELAARWNLRIDWGSDDPGDEDFLAGTDIPELMALAHDRLREHGYTLWTWNTGTDAHAGWIALRRDDEAMQALSTLLGIEARPGSDAF